MHEDEDAFVMVAGADNKAHKRKVTVGLTTPKVAEISSGLKAGDAVIVQGQQGFPTAPTSRRQMSLSSSVERYGLAIVTVTVLLAAAGLLSAFQLPSRHLSPADLSARRRHRTQRHAARAGDDADGHPADRAGDPRGARHPPRAVD